MSQRLCTIIILAAGQSQRFCSSKSKVMHMVAGRPMVGHVIAAAVDSGVDRIAVVHGKGMSDVKSYTQALIQEIWKGGDFLLFEQGDKRGTAAAVLAARPVLESSNSNILILFGDTPLISPDVIRTALSALNEGAHVVVVGFQAADPSGYGRLIMGDNNRLLAIREHCDANIRELEINLCNSGFMALAGEHALSLLSSVDSGNRGGEFYLSEIPFYANKLGLKVKVVICSEDDGLGVNTRSDLARVESIAQTRLRNKVLNSGVTMVAPETVFLSYDTRFGYDVLIEPNAFFGPGVSVGSGTVIHAFCHMVGVTIGENARIGPFARLRSGVTIENDVKIGNFVELKESMIRNNVRINHLSYIGDADIGVGANIGAGVITCNYDGLQKSKTEIGSKAFIGCNSSLVAPVRIGEGAYIGSGSVITESVENGDLALERNVQIVKKGWVVGFMEKKQTK